MKTEKDKLEFPCPCGGKVKWVEKEVRIEGINCGTLDIEFCETCGSEYLPEESMRIVQQKLKEKGLWGVEHRAVSFWKSGNSVVLRVPKKIADVLHLKPAMRAFIHPEGKNKLVVEV